MADASEHRRALPESGVKGPEERIGLDSHPEEWIATDEAKEADHGARPCEREVTPEEGREHPWEHGRCGKVLGLNMLGRTRLTAAKQTRRPSVRDDVDTSEIWSAAGRWREKAVTATERSAGDKGRSGI